MPDYIDIQQNETRNLTFQWGNATRVFRKDSTKPPYYKFDLDSGQSLRASQNLAEELAGNWPGAQGQAKIHALPGDQYEIEIVSQEYAQPYPLKISEWDNNQGRYAEADVWDVDLGEFRKVGAQDAPRTPQTEAAAQAPQTPQTATIPPAATSAPQPQTPAPAGSYGAFLKNLDQCLLDAAVAWGRLTHEVKVELQGDHAGAIQDIAVHLSIECSKRGWTAGSPSPVTADPPKVTAEPPPPEDPPPATPATNDYGDELPF